jgi:hypothetical protein
VKELSPSEVKMWGKMDTEKCPVCGKQVIFSMHMTRSDYTWKFIGKDGKIKYCCGYNHYNQARGKGR